MSVNGVSCKKREIFQVDRFNEGLNNSEKGWIFFNKPIYLPCLHHQTVEFLFSTSDRHVSTKAVRITCLVG